MLDYLKDIVSHTYGLGIINLVKVTGTKTETLIESLSDDKTVIVKAKTVAPVAEFVGQFGMPNLNKLNIILNIPEYKEDANISVTSKKVEDGVVLTGLHFENKTGDFKNDYRFMTSAMVNETLKTIKFKGVKWNVEFVPSVQHIQRMKFMTQANSEETTFIAKTDSGDLKFYFGDHSSHAGDFVFHKNVNGSLTRGFMWPVSVVNSILSLTGEKMYRISDEGATQITVDTGLVTYDYILPAMQK
jgi:hypothetical protein